eukprot:jgi/Mesvir1/29764/Mv16426-RA.2
MNACLIFFVADCLRVTDINFADAIQECSNIEAQSEGAEEKKDQAQALTAVAETIKAIDQKRAQWVDRNLAAIDISWALFGKSGKLKLPPADSRNKAKIAKYNDRWQPRWDGDRGDTFLPYQQLVVQYLHGAMEYHANALQQLSDCYAKLDKAARDAEDVDRMKTEAALGGISMKEYRQLKSIFERIDTSGHGHIDKQALIRAMRKDKDIAAFMQLSRRNLKGNKKETFEAVFDRIDADGSQEISWEEFLSFFSDRPTLSKTT